MNRCLELLKGSVYVAAAVVCAASIIAAVVAFTQGQTEWGWLFATFSITLPIITFATWMDD